MDKRVIWVGIASFLIIGFTLVLNMLFTQNVDFRGSSYVEPYPVAADFELLRSNGDVFRLSGQRDKVILLFFGYTTCPDVCPTTLAELNMALNQLPDKAKQVQVVFISVDPDRDTLQAVQEYVGRFNPSFIGLSGSFDELQKIWQDYGVFREVTQSDSAAGVIINHTARVTLIDRQGNLRLSYGFGTPVEDIVHDLNLILK
ncbi:MAG: SCO family protein [Anaerolineales bacterium]|nr:MAG: SCO family protein [Anaerolineales bacterium]